MTQQQFRLVNQPPDPPAVTLNELDGGDKFIAVSQSRIQPLGIFVRTRHCEAMLKTVPIVAFDLATGNPWARQYLSGCTFHRVEIVGRDPTDNAALYDYVR